MSINKDKIPTYKCAVSNLLDEPCQENALLFKETIVEAIQSGCLRNDAIEKSTFTKNIKNQFMIDIIDSIGCLTRDITEHYSSKGIANELKTGDILDCLEKSIMIESNNNMDIDNTSDEDDAF
jgi:hypothetical protein